MNPHEVSGPCPCEATPRAVYDAQRAEHRIRRAEALEQQTGRREHDRHCARCSDVHEDAVAAASCSRVEETLRRALAAIRLPRPRKQTLAEDERRQVAS